MEGDLSMNIKKEPFGQTGDGKKVWLFTLRNDHNITMKIINYGGILTSLLVPDKNGKVDDVVLGFNTLQEYLTDHPYLGALIGRYGNRIAQGKFVLNEKEYQLAANNGENHLHGGIKGFDKKVWDAAELKSNEEVGVKLTYLSKDGEEGYPGNLSTTVTYFLNNNNEWVITYEATTDKPTVINLTQHSYFNLAGEGSGDILGHEMMILADGYTAVNESLIPTGELKKVENSPMDFMTPKAIGARIGEVPGGYDQNYILNRVGDQPSLAAKVYEPKSGRIMEVFTTEPGIQLYSGNFLDGTFKGKSGKSYQKHAGFCLETQHFPDSPNQLNFPNVILNPGKTYHQETIYKFSI
jgi:aldose 1-epimerase